VTSFRRYTNLAATVHMLRTQSITLLNPATWDDKNDAYFMAEYKRLKRAKTVLALCFAERAETYHHWRVFSHGSDGVCIEFDKDKLLSTFKNDKHIRQSYVSYKMLRELSKMKAVDVDELPFLKRYPYEDECEYRVVYVDTGEAAEFADYDLTIGWIKRVTLSPWMSKALAQSVKETIKSIEGCSRLVVTRSTLVDNEAWKKVTTRVRG
jgi:Protein of unknown function (DUF2971)